MHPDRPIVNLVTVREVLSYKKNGFSTICIASRARVLPLPGAFGAGSGVKLVTGRICRIIREICRIIRENRGKVPDISGKSPGYIGKKCRRGVLRGFPWGSRTFREAPFGPGWRANGAK